MPKTDVDIDAKPILEAFAGRYRGLVFGRHPVRHALDVALILSLEWTRQHVRGFADWPVPRPEDLAGVAVWCAGAAVPDMVVIYLEKEDRVILSYAVGLGTVLGILDAVLELRRLDAVP